MTSGPPTRRRDASRLAAWVLVLAGTAWFLASVGFVPERFVRAGALLWPLVLIGLGLDLWGVRRPPAGIPYSLVALAAIAVVGIFLPRAETRVPEGALGFTEPIAGANRAEVALDAGMTSLLVRGGASDGMLVEGTALGAARLASDARGRAVRRIDIVARGPVERDGAAGRAAADAELRLSDRLPIALAVRGGGRATTLDLSGLDLAGVQYTGAAGPASITLGGVGPERFDAEIVGGRGPLDVTLPAGTRVNLRLEPGAGGAAVTVAPRVDASVVLRAGDGPVAMALPEEARVRVVVEDPAGGIVSVPDRLRKVESVDAGDESDVYETPGFRYVIPALEIRIEETGRGPIVIR